MKSITSSRLFIYLFIYLFIHLFHIYGTEHTTQWGSNLSVSLQITHPAQPTGVHVPYSFRTVVWVLLRPTRTLQISESTVRRDLRFLALI